MDNIRRIMRIFCPTNICHPLLIQFLSPCPLRSLIVISDYALFLRLYSDGVRPVSALKHLPKYLASEKPTL